MDGIPIGKKIALPGHFSQDVVLEAVRPLGGGFECRVRLGDGMYQVARDRIVFERTIPEDEIDLESGFLIMPSALPLAPQPAKPTDSGSIHDGVGDGYDPSAGGETDPAPPGDTSGPRPGVVSGEKQVSLRISGSRDQLFQAWQAIANLTDKAGKVSLQTSATSEQGFEQTWLRNAVYEPLEEADVLTEE